MDTPCPTTIIPAMDKMHDELTVAANNTEYLPVLWAALSRARTLFDKYYSLSNESKVYCITMSMPPSFIPLQPSDLMIASSSLLQIQTQIFYQAWMG